jgi:hypothetical protein
MYHPLRGAMLDLEVQCLKVQGLKWRDPVAVVHGEVRVVVNMTLSLVAVLFALSHAVLADPVFPHVVIALLTWDIV